MASQDSSDCNAFLGPILPPNMSKTRAASMGDDQSESSRNEDVVIGPSLPAQLIHSQTTSTTASNEEFGGTTSRDDIGLKLPSHLVSNPADDSQRGPVMSSRTMDTNSERPAVAGPLLSPNFLGKDDQGTSESDDDTYGPALPPGFVSESRRTESEVNTFGPALPSGLKRTTDEDQESEEELDNESSSEDEFVGPMPLSVGDVVNQRSAADELEARAAAMKKRLTTKEEEVAPSRDSWMTELPDFSKNFGLGPRTFRKNARPDKQDRSGWTETPADREKKQRERIEKAAAEKRSSSKDKKKKERREEKRVSERDRRLADEVAIHNEKARPESLMDMHTKSRKRKLETEGLQKQERRPFDRETDLQVNRFDEARRKQLLKKSAHLGDKFSHSSDKMYL